MRTEYIEVDRDYIMKHRTKKGSWTRSQIQALGIEWPPRNGWIDEIVGVTISPNQQMQFEAKLSAGRERQENQKKMKLNKAIKVCESAGFIVVPKPKTKKLRISG